MAALKHNAATMADAADWITVEEAASLTKESERTWQRRAQRASETALREGRSPQAKLAGSHGGRGRSAWWVHRSMDRRLTRFPSKESREDRAREALSKRYPQHQIDQAYRRAYWLREWRTLCNSSHGTEREAAERIVAQAKRIEGEGFRVSFRTLQGWQRKYNRVEPDGQIGGVEAPMLLT